MESISEVFAVSDSSNQSTVCAFYDLKSGALISTFKDGGNATNCAKKSLSFIGQDFVISAAINQPIVRVWTLLSKNVDMLKIIVPGVVSSLVVSNCGMYCAAGIDKLIYVWEVATGALMTCLQHHSQTVTCLKFSSDGSHIISGSKDGMVLVWLLSEVVSASESSDNVKPRFQWLHHAAGITDIYVGSLGIFSRVATVSKDMTCRIYELEMGNLLTTVHVDFVITAVTMDEAEYFLLLGSAEGNIYRINMFPLNSAEVEYNCSKKQCIYEGHSKEITCLSVSTSGKYLLSGSEDCYCRIWDLMTFTCVRKLKFEGSITNAFITFMPPGLKTESQYHPRMKVSSFKRHYDQDDNDIDYITTGIEARKLSLMHLGSPDEHFDSYVLNCSEDSLTALNRNHISEGKMHLINNQMYSFALCEAYNIPEDSESQNGDSD